jgi:hypothetical protein
VQMTAQEYARTVGIEPGSVANLLREPKGVLAGAPRLPGVFTEADVLVYLVFEELTDLLGAASDRPWQIVREIAPRLRIMAQNRQVPSRFRIRCDRDGAEFTVNIPGYQLLERATAVA